MLLDHFHPPLKGTRHWEGFHSRWAGNIATDLNQRLPEGWFAEPTVHWSIEADVAAFEKAGIFAGAGPSGSDWVEDARPAPQRTLTIPLGTDSVQVRVFRDDADLPLVAVVELVSPSNKDRAETRDAFVSKCVSYLHDLVGLVIVDVVTSRHSNLHEELLERWGETAEAEEPTYCSAYHPRVRGELTELAIWHEPLTIGHPLPPMPLFLSNGPFLTLHLQETYLQTCRDLRVSNPGNS